MAQGCFYWGCMGVPRAVYFGLQLSSRRALDFDGDRCRYRGLDWDQVVRLEVDSASSGPVANSTWMLQWKSASPNRAFENSREFTGYRVKVWVLEEQFNRGSVSKETPLE